MLKIPVIAFLLLGRYSCTYDHRDDHEHERRRVHIHVETHTLVPAARVDGFVATPSAWFEETPDGLVEHAPGAWPEGVAPRPAELFDEDGDGRVDRVVFVDGEAVG